MFLERKEDIRTLVEKLTHSSFELELFIKHSRNNPPSNPRRDNPNQWEIAVLSPYQKQRKALVSMVQQLTGLDRFMRFNLAEMERSRTYYYRCQYYRSIPRAVEADIVFISLRNSSRIGFLDSPNRMNVAITRA